MKNFDFQTDLKRVIDSKLLVEINLGLGGNLNHVVAYIINANDDYLTFARISNDATLQGVTICLMRDIESIQTETKFIKELMKDITDDSLYQRVKKDIDKIKDFTFLGFISAFEATNTIIDITSENESYTGRVFAHDDKILVIDEYYAEDDGRFARSYINPSIITSITVGGTWLKIIARSLADKGI
jgi:hypothetical protein